MNTQVLAQGNDGSSIVSTPDGVVTYSRDGVPTLLPADYANTVLNLINEAGGLDPVAAAGIADAARRFDAGLRFDVARGNAAALQNAAQFNARLQFDAGQANAAAAQGAAQFNAQQRFNVEQANAANALRAAEANQAARLRVQELNASLRTQQAQLAEQIRQFDIDDARQRENLRFLLRKEQVATEEGNRASLQNAHALREQVSARIENNRLQRQQMVTEVKSLNAQMENNVRVFNAQEAARVEQLNEQRRQANLDRLERVSAQIGELAQNPADVGKLAAFLRSGRPNAISSAIARGEDAITDESLLGLRGLLGVRDELQRGPTLATGNFIDAELVDVPEFATPLGTAPAIEELFQPITFDPSGIERGPSAAAGDLGAAFAPLGLPPEVQARLVTLPPEVQAQIVKLPPEVQAQVLGMPAFAAGGAPPTSGSGGAGGGAAAPVQAPAGQVSAQGHPSGDFIASQPVGTQVTGPSGVTFENRGLPDGALSRVSDGSVPGSGITDEEFDLIPDWVKEGLQQQGNPSAPLSTPAVTRESLTNQGFNVDPSLSDQQIADFYSGFSPSNATPPTSTASRSGVTRESLTSQGVHVDPKLSDRQIADFFQGLDTAPAAPSPTASTTTRRPGPGSTRTAGSPASRKPRSSGSAAAGWPHPGRR